MSWFHPQRLRTAWKKYEGFHKINTTVYYPGHFHFGQATSDWAYCFLLPQKEKRSKLKRKKKRKAIIKSKFGTKQKKEIANSNYFVWKYFGKVTNKAGNSKYFSVIYDSAKWKQCWNALPCLITDSFMAIPRFAIVLLYLWKLNIFWESWFVFLKICFHNTENENSLIIKKHFHKLFYFTLLNWTAFCFQETPVNLYHCSLYMIS